MKKFRHTRRSVILFFLLGILTLFIYDIVVLTHVGKDINRINENKEGYRKSMNFVAVFFLGIITLGIVPIVWMTRVANRIGFAARERGIAHPSIGGASFFFLFFFFSFTIVCPIIGLTKFLHTLNKLERTINEEIDSSAKAEAEATILEPEAPAALEAPEEPVVEEAPAEEAPTEEAPVEEPEPEQPPFEYVAEVTPEEEEKPAEPEETPAEPTPEDEIASVYHVAGRDEIRKWRVRIPGSESAVKVFDTREEALAYAKGLAARKHATVRVKRS